MPHLSSGSEDAISGGYVYSPRAGFWYFLKYYGYGPYNKNDCPSGTSLAYIKTATEWADFKYLAGNKFQL